MTEPIGILSNDPNEYAEFLRKNKNKTTGVKGYESYITTGAAGGDVQVAGRSYNTATAYNLANTQDPSTYKEIVATLRAVGALTGDNPKRSSVVTTWQRFLDMFNNQASDSPKDWFRFVNDEVELHANNLGVDTGTSTFIQPRFTTPEDARQDLAIAYREYLGVDPDTSEFRKSFNSDFKEYYKELRKLEKAQPTRQTTVRGAGGTTVQTLVKGFDEQDLEELKLRYITKYVETKGVENIGGAVASNLRAIKKFVSDYNVALPDLDIRQLALDAIRNRTGLDNAQNKIVSLAKAGFPALIPYIDQGLTVRDIASQFIAKKAAVLEMSPESISLNDPDILSALQGTKLEFLFDFEKRLRKNPMWQFTNNAREEAASFSTMALNDFGVL